LRIIPGLASLAALAVFALPETAVATVAAASDAAAAAASGWDAEAPRVMSLSQALERTAAASPALATADARLRATEARQRDAARRPNPTLEALAENWGGSLGYGRIETTVELRQPLELGGDRGARRDAASAEVDAAHLERKRLQRALASGVAEDFIAAWALQERLWRLRDTRRIAAEAVVAAGQRLAAGAAPSVERIRAAGDLTLAEVAVARTAAELSAARRALALHWNRSEADFDSLALPRPSLAPPPALDSARTALARHPERALAATDSALAAAHVRMAHAARVPDLDARFGVRDLREAGGVGWVAGAALQLPLWNSQRGAVDAAEAEWAQAARARFALDRRLESQLRSAIERLAASTDAFRELDERGVPTADAAFAAVRSDYRAGRLSYLDLVAAQRAALEARLAAVEGAAEVWRARVELERLLGPAATAIPEEVNR
jgi:cobalt-zinc-cadmium efflux system outer membrane protein